MMKFLTATSFFAGLVTLTVGYAIDIDNNALAARDILKAASLEGGVLLETRAGGCPGIPKKADDDLFHVISRLDTRGITYVGNKVSGKEVSMTGLNQLITTMGGRHHDVLVGKKTGTCYVYGLLFDGKTFLDHQDGDGAAITGPQSTYSSISGEKLTYIGALPKTFTIATAASNMKSIVQGYGTYDHKSKNCQTAANALIKALNPK